jgi:hypothetical protein
MSELEVNYLIRYYNLPKWREKQLWHLKNW